MEKNKINEIKHFQFIGSSNIIPSDYANIGYYFEFLEPDGLDNYDRVIDTDIDDDDFLNSFGGDPLYIASVVSDISPSTRKSRVCKCNVCNQDVKRFLYLKNTKTGEVITAGLDCAEQIFKYKGLFSGAKKQTLLEKKKRELFNKINEFFSIHPEMEDLLTVNDRRIREMATNFRKYGSLSDKQIAFIKILAEKRVSLESTAKPAPSGKIKNVEYTVLSCKYNGTSMYGNSLSWKVLLQHEDGHKLFYGGSCVSLNDIISEIHGNIDTSHNNPQFINTPDQTNPIGANSEGLFFNQVQFLKGIKVLVSGNVTVSKDDNLFGFIKTAKFDI